MKPEYAIRDIKSKKFVRFDDHDEWYLDHRIDTLKSKPTKELFNQIQEFLEDSKLEIVKVTINIEPI